MILSWLHRWLKQSTASRRWPRRLAARKFAVPRLEALEGRLVPSTLMVSNTNDSGPGSLRQAILDVDAGAGGGHDRLQHWRRGGADH
jgi:hypothetical protein